jgi:hypothetical protein
LNAGNQISFLSFTTAHNCRTARGPLLSSYSLGAWLW